MFPGVETAMGLNQALFWLAQIGEPTLDDPEDLEWLISGPQFFVALVAGVLLAFAFQLLLTNLGVATGLSLIGGGGRSDSDSREEAWSLGGTIRKVSIGLGLATLVTVTIALFAACILAVKLSLTQSAGLGAIMGLVIWATYFCLLVWVSSTTVGSFIGSVVNTATSGFQTLVGTATAAFGGAAASKQAVATAEAAASAVRRELTAGLDPEGIREKLEDYLETLRPPQLDYQKIQQDVEGLLRDPRFEELAGGDLSRVNRQTFVDLVSSRSDLSKQEINRIVDQLERAWNRAVSKLPSRGRLEEFTDYLKEAAPNQLLGSEFTQKLDNLVEELRKRRKAESPGLMSQAMTLGINSFTGILMGRTDLSDFDIEKIAGQLQQAKDKLGEQTDQVKSHLRGGTHPYSPVRADVDNYLLNTYSWQMTQDRLAREFRNVIYDLEADPSTVARELEQLDRGYLTEILQRRGVFTQSRIREISQWLEEIRLEALAEAWAAEEQRRAIALFSTVEVYLLTTPKEDLTPEKIQLNFKLILEDPDAGYEQLSNRLAQFDRSTLERLLDQRNDLIPTEVTVIVPELETARDRALAESQELQEAAKAKVEAQWFKLASYLRETGREELKPEGIERDLKTLLEDPQAGVALMRVRASRFERDTLVQLLSQREDLSEEQVNRILDQVEATWTRVRYTPQQLVGQAKEQYDQTMTAIADYLRSTGKDELNPEGIQQDLTLLLNDPKLGTQALRMRLAEADRDTLVKLLSQREDLSEEQVNQIIDQVQVTLRGIARAPRRLATRAKTQVLDFEAVLEDYLRNTGKEALNPEGIKRDIQELLHHPRLGVSSLGDRLSRFDRSTMIALLSQREDISEAEATRIVDQIFSVRDQFVEQLQSIQRRIQSVVDSILAQIRNYLNSFERAELNYDGIKRDIRTLFDDPQAGFEAMRARLGQFDRGTLVAILSSREDISEADANRIVDQIEQTRNRVLQRAERIQHEAQRRIDEVKHQAQQQVEETRKAAAAAAWWLFGTALISGIASVAAGALAVAG